MINNEPFGEKIIRLHDNPVRGGVEVYLGIRDNEKLHTSNLEFTEVEEGERVNPLTTLSPPETQQLFNELWRIGYRPSKGYQEGMEATQNHLSDMRKIVSSKLGVDL